MNTNIEYTVCNEFALMQKNFRTIIFSGGWRIEDNIEHTKHQFESDTVVEISLKYKQWQHT